jgi:hypothetical protein
MSAMDELELHDALYEAEFERLVNSNDPHDLAQLNPAAVREYWIAWGRSNPQTERRGQVAMPPMRRPK